MLWDKMQPKIAHTIGLATRKIRLSNSADRQWFDTRPDGTYSDKTPTAKPPSPLPKLLHQHIALLLQIFRNRIDPPGMQKEPCQAQHAYHHASPMAPR